MTGFATGMTPLRLFAIAFIFVCTAVAWMILGGTVTERSGEKDSSLSREVALLWGGEHTQLLPTATLITTRLVTTDENVIDNDGKLLGSKKVTRTVEDRTPLLLDKSDVHVEIELEHRKKGLLWFPTYAVRVRGDHVVTAAADGEIEAALAFPSSEAIYDGFAFSVGDKNAGAVNDLARGALVRVPVKRGEVLPVHMAYASRGLGSWRYAFGAGGVSQVKDFTLTMSTNTADVDFPVGSMSPTQKQLDGEHATLTWSFASVVTGQQIGVEVPALLNPGPVAARISFFAPVSLLFFFAVMVILGVVRHRNMHPMNYGFVAAGFFAFHLLLAYLVDVMELFPAFAIASVVSLGIVLSYLRIVLGQLGADRRLFLQAGAAQLIFLVGFSAAFFHEGRSGLTIAIGAVVTLFVLMQLTARVRWAEVFGAPPSLSGSPVGLPSSMSMSMSTSTSTPTTPAPKP